ncbi:protein DMP2 [Ziziphus jujuba]|uniref:Protein DMP2 n=1 Tax=Ziziphus jujuba TaxID=326968 RepID=A0A6P4A3V1_ZIZJJ|nr:protein DMP2 [Ziziphus jujuba]
MVESNNESTPKKGVAQGFGGLIKFLPTGTVFLFQFLNPAVTNYGKCSTANKCLEAILICFCGLSCFFSCFTDSYKKDGKIYHGIVTKNGLWLSSPPSESLDDLKAAKYRLKVSDLVHAFFSLVVFAALSLLDSNTVRCLYPRLESTGSQKTLIGVLPPVLGVVSGAMCTMFPSDRHGIGYTPSSTTGSSEKTSNNSISEMEKSANK